MQLPKLIGESLSVQLQEIFQQKPKHWEKTEPSVRCLRRISLHTVLSFPHAVAN